MSKTLQQQLVRESSLLPYKLLLVLLFPYLLFITLKKSFQGGGLKYFGQRFGFGLPKVKKPIWFHGASVGEINALLPLISAYKEKHPDEKVLVSCNTPTAFQLLKKQQWSHYSYCYLPLDLAGPVDSFVLLINPAKAIIIETELWPNLYAACARNKTEITIINGRISNRTLNSNFIIRKAYAFCMDNVRHIYCRTKQDKQGFESIGANPKKVTVLGNIKYSCVNADMATNLIPRPFVLLASSHNNEEQQITQMWKNNALAKTHLLVIAPRHPERSNAISKQIKALGLSIAIRSKKQKIDNNTQVYLADTIGEMNIWYQHADLVIMAGSFIEHGGQNFIEPASFGKVIITGSHTKNFADDVMLFLQKQAIIQVNTVDELGEKLTALASNPCLYNEFANNARKLIKQHKGIIEKYLAVI